MTNNPFDSAQTRRIGHFLLPLTGIVMVGLMWLAASQSIPDLPSPLRTWEESKLYLLQPFEKRGEMDQGIALLAYYSLVRVSKGFVLGIAIATPLGLLLGMSQTLNRMFDPLIQILHGNRGNILHQGKRRGMLRRSIGDDRLRLIDNRAPGNKFRHRQANHMPGQSVQDAFSGAMIPILRPDKSFRG